MSSGDQLCPCSICGGLHGEYACTHKTKPLEDKNAELRRLLAEALDIRDYEQGVIRAAEGYMMALARFRVAGCQDPEVDPGAQGALDDAEEKLCDALQALAEKKSVVEAKVP